MANHDLDRYAGEPVDQLVSVQLYPSGGPPTFVGMPAGSPPYQASRELRTDPLSYVAASRLVDEVSPGDFVVRSTSCLVPRAMAPESDCAIGAVGLGRGLMAGRRAYRRGAATNATPCAIRANGVILREAPWLRSFAPSRPAFRITLCTASSCSTSWGYLGKGRVRVRSARRDGLAFGHGGARLPLHSKQSA